MNANRLHTTPPRNARGFSLMELMVVVIIIGVLAAIAVPGYQSYMIESRRSIGATALTELAARMERFFSDNNTYATATIGGAAGDIYPNWVPSDQACCGYYTIVFPPPSASTTTWNDPGAGGGLAWTAQARPVAGGPQAGDGILQLTSTGIRTYNPASDTDPTGGQNNWNW